MEEDDNIYLESQIFSEYQPKTNQRKRRSSHIKTGVKNRSVFLLELHAAQAHPPVESLPDLAVLRVVEVARLGQKVGADGVQYGWHDSQT